MATEAPKRPKFGYFTHPRLDKSYIFIAPVTQKAFDDALSYKAASGDVFVVTYPKCGTTWILQVLLLMRNGGKSLEKDKNLYDEIPFLETGDREKAERPQKDMKIIKTHLYYDLTPWNPEAKYIYIARNPKDCFVSFFHHTAGFKLYDYSDGKFDDYFELIIKGDVDSGDYFKCVGEWYEKSKTEKNILFLLYEDLKVDPRREILKIADFLGPEWGVKMRADDNDLLEKVVDKSSFKKMSQMKNILQEGFDRPEHIPFVRKGVIGDWKELFNEDQSRRVDARLRQAGEKYPGFDHLWDKYSELLTF